MTNETVKGFRDFTGKEAEKRAFVKEVIRRTFEKYNFEQVETPIIEYEDFVKSGNADDEAVSDVFKLQDKGKRNLALRYEFTFQLKRIANNKKLPYKRFQIGPVFRDEPVSGNRLRQFTQCDVDIVGSSVKDDAEILAITSEILNNLKIENTIYVGNRELLNQILEAQGIKKNKEQILREVDKLDKLSEKEVASNLKKYNVESILKVLKKDESYFKKFEAYKDVEELKRYCRYFGVKVVFQPSLVRGLSYYNKNVFEVKTKGLKETICGGGSYLIEGIQATGISFGLERLQLITKMLVNIEKILIVSLNEDKKAIEVSQQLRKQGKNVSVFYGKPSKALEYANSYGIKKVIFVGKKEVEKKKFMIKNMQTGRQKLIVIGKKLGV